jgi:acetoin utilization deacetylase AcuC-like enzyme
MEKFPDAHALVQDAVEVCPVPRLERAVIERAHEPAYLDAVNRDDARGAPHGLVRYDRNRLGLPATPTLLERSILETAGTVAATLAALEVGMAANLAGGTHHAFPGRGLGFCVLNDVAVAIERLRTLGCKPDQTLIIDTDAHQGNANHAYFRGDPAVFTYSLHVGKNYPAAKEPGDCDVALPRWVDGADYLAALKKSLPPVLAETEPDLIFWISGADCHCGDRFGQMQLSSGEMAARDAFVLQLCREYAAPTVVVYGGGYNREPGMTGWLHAQTILAAQRAHTSA